MAIRFLRLRNKQYEFLLNIYSLLFLWFLNFSSIIILFNLGINKNIAAFLVIPFLVVLSYFCQSRYVFK